MEEMLHLKPLGFFNVCLIFQGMKDRKKITIVSKLCQLCQKYIVTWGVNLTTCIVKSVSHMKFLPDYVQKNQE